MKYKIVVDSCTDLTKEMVTSMNIEIAPLSLEVGGVRYIDDDTLDIPAYLEKANGHGEVPKTACPSPDDYLTRYRGEEEGVFVVTLSSELSGSYSTAVLAKDLMADEDPKKKVHVVDSRAAASAQVAITLKVYECIQAGMAFDRIVEVVEAYRDELATVFVLEKIDHLQKAGRMSKTKLTIATVLNIKLVLKANKEGEILLHSQARGTKKALDKMIKSFGEVGKISKDKIVVISHVLAEKRALDVKASIEDKYDFKEVIIVPTRGISSNYANKGGIVISF